MTFQPLLPFGGLAGWQYLKRTAPEQIEAYANSGANLRDSEYFAAEIRNIQTAEQLVDDRRLLRVSLAAFGLEEDIDSKFFVRKILEEGSLNNDSLANRLADKRYLEFAKAFGFGDFPVPNTQLSDFPDRILSAFRERSFEAAVGEQNGDLRLALSLEREFTDIAGDSTNNNTKWFAILGNPPLRSVFESAFNLPSSFAGLPIDKQVEIFRDRASSRFGSDVVTELAEPETIERITQSFLLAKQVAQANPIVAGSTALALLNSPATLRL